MSGAEHDRDAEPRDAAWNRVSEQFASLGESLRRRYDEEDEADRPEGAVDSVTEALRTLGDAAERLAGTVGGAIRDPEVQANARSAASSLVDALGLTFSRITDEARRRMERPREGADDPWDAEPPPTAEITDTQTTTTPPD